MIPARGGSKGIPRQNVALLGGKPLIAYSIESALRSRYITRVIVSTDDQEIAEVARAFGAEVPFLRPAELATDHADLGETISYTLQRLQNDGYTCQAVVNLFPTSPFRSPGFIDHMVGKFSEGYQNIQTARRIPLEGGPLYHVNGHGDQAHPLAFLAANRRFCMRAYGVLSGACLTPAFRGVYVHYLDDPVMAIDIDTPEDMRLAEDVMACNLFNFEAA